MPILKNVSWLGPAGASNPNSSPGLNKAPIDPAVASALFARDSAALKQKQAFQMQLLISYQSCTMAGFRRKVTSLSDTVRRSTTQDARLGNKHKLSETGHEAVLPYQAKPSCVCMGIG
jgi:hypothetical protein